MKLGIVGSRGFNDKEFFDSKVKLCIEHYGITEIVSGGAIGADNFAEEFAFEHNLKLTVHKAEWDKYGLSAGFKRNKDIWKDSDIIIAFWDGISKGTKHTIDNYKGKLFVFIYTNENLI